MCKVDDWFRWFTWSGTYEKISEEEEEIYEVINIHKMKSATPNLRVVNLYGINFVDDSHVEAFSSNCIQVFKFILISKRFKMNDADYFYDNGSWSVWP